MCVGASNSVPETHCKGLGVWQYAPPENFEKYVLRNAFWGIIR